MSVRDQKIAALNSLLNATLAGVSPAVDLASVLGMLEATRATGLFRARENGSLSDTYYLRFSQGRLVYSIGDPISNLAGMLGSKDLTWTFKAVPNPPSGKLDLSVTGLMLEAAKAIDHAMRDEETDVDDVPSITETLQPTRRIGQQLRLVG